MSRRRQTNLLGSLVVAVVCLSLAIALLVLLPNPANRTHTTRSLTPGTITLPPTAPAVAITPTAR